MPNNDFLIELKKNCNLMEVLKSYQPSSMTMDQFRTKFVHLHEISQEYVRTKSSDAYAMAIWMHNMEKFERLNRIRQREIESQQQLQSKLIELNINLSYKQKEMQFIKDKIKTLKKNIAQVENYRYVLHQSN